MVLTHLFFLILDACFALFFSSMHLKLEEPSTHAIGERVAALSPTSVLQDGIHDL